MTDAWGGPQWVLATWLASTLLMALAVRVAGHNRQPFAKWIGWYAYRLTSTATLVAILAWGGFWGSR